MSESKPENGASQNFSRRGLLMGSAALGSGVAALGARDAAGAASQAAPSAVTPIPVPPQVPAKEALAELPDTRLWHWDTGAPDGPSCSCIRRPAAR